MKINNTVIFLSFILVAMICIGSAAAVEDNETVDSLNLDDESEDSLLTSPSDELPLSASQTIDVDNVGEDHNEMNEHTIRNAINSANAGDTLIINGQSYDHVHITIDKQLTIKSDVGTVLNPCSSTAVSGHSGIFYITAQASGTIIEGFNFRNDNGNIFSSDDYGILVNGASNVIIRNCTFSTDNSGDAIRLENANAVTIDNVSISNAENGINIKNSQNTLVKNSIITASNYGIDDVDSAKTTITSNNIFNNKISGILVEGTSSNPTISFNNITCNVKGISLTSCDNINILSNYIAEHSDYGVYVNCPVVQLNIIGNFFYMNSYPDGGGEIYNGPNAHGFFKEGGEKFYVVNNNYFVGNNVRPVNNAKSGGAFLGYTFEINENVACPILHYKYETALWSDGNYRLKLSEVSQSKKGIYTISIVDANGNVAKGLGSVPVIFYMNKDNNYVAPQEGDVYKKVMMVDGTATVRFYPEDFKETGNVLTVVLPGTSDYLTGDSYQNVKTFNVNDSLIPGNVTATKISVSDLSTYPQSNANIAVTLTDIYNNPIMGEEVTFTIGSKTLMAKTDSSGKAAFKISENAGIYNVKIVYVGDDIDYSASTAQAKVTVKKISTKIVASNYAMFIKKADYYQLTLKDSTGNALAGQKVTIKVNKKTYAKKTNSNGIIKLKLKLKKGTYKVVMNYKGTAKYAATKKTAKISVKKVLKTKLIAPKVTTAPKTSTKYTVTLKNENGKALKSQKVTIKVNGKTYTKKTNSKGQATIKVRFSKLKTYNVKAAYKKTKSYQKSSATGKITVQKIVTKITAPNMETNPNTAKDYTVTLKTSTGKALAKQTLKIAVNGNTYSKTTDSNGKVTIQPVFNIENTYKATVTYAGTAIYKNSNAAGTIKVSRMTTDLVSYNRTFSMDSSEKYSITLKDSNGNAIVNQNIAYTLNNQNYSKSTDENGQVKINVSGLGVGTYDIVSTYSQTNQYRSAESRSTITISDKVGVTFIDANLPGDEIQARFNEASGKVEFLGNSYDDVSLTINKPVDIIFLPNTVLNGKAGSPVLTIAVSNFNISNLAINANEGLGIVIRDVRNVSIINNTISNALDQSKADGYGAGEILIPGNGIEIVNASDIQISKNDVSSFGNAIFLKDSDDLEISNNTLTLSNYGITYGEGVKNTNVTKNLITKNIGLYVMDVPEGPLGYGIFLNQSAVNVSITHNRILDNYMGISVDSIYSTGIVITSNWISDNALEGIRFNAGYGLAENAVEPDVNDNAIYRNAKGPSMMILGELSANPEGIYKYGPEDDTKKLQLGANWFGRNARVTWDYDHNITGYGTMCPRINATYISTGDIEVVSPGTYSITFYKRGEVASKLPEFEMYATLNDKVELKFYVVDGVGTFTFDSSSFDAQSNIIKVSIGSLFDQYRTFVVLVNKTLDSSEIPI